MAANYIIGRLIISRFILQNNHRNRQNASAFWTIFLFLQFNEKTGRRQFIAAFLNEYKIFFVQKLMIISFKTKDITDAFHP